MAVPRFFAPALEAGANEVTLPPDEAQHLTRVLRLGVGAEVAVFDGRGREFRARVARASKGVVTLALVAPVDPVAEPRVALTVAQAVLKADKMDDVVRDATMLGAAAIVPLVTARSVVPARAAHAAVERWTRVAIASAKQCGRAVVPVISAPVTVAGWVEADRAEARLWLAEPSLANPADSRSLREMAAPRSASLTVGPEGGWTDEEIAVAQQAGYRMTTVGPRTLRADAVALAGLAILGYLWE